MQVSLTSALLALLILSVGIMSVERVSINTIPSAVRQGEHIWVVCRIQRHEDNRKLTISMPYHRSTDYELHGKQTPAMFSFLVRDVPCLPVMAVACQLETNHDHVLASKPLSVIGCS